MPLALYNLFPRYYQNCTDWVHVFPHIKRLGFNTIYINPIHYPGFSGSLYAPKNYYALNPLCYDATSTEPPMTQLSRVLKEAHEHGLKVVMDLVINHTSKDHPFIQEHPQWYSYDQKGEVLSPGAWNNDTWVTWGDLAQIDNIGSSDKENLWTYWETLIEFYLQLGFDGFRADAAYQIPSPLWQQLIQKGQSIKPDVLFLAESLGCTPAQSKDLVEAGFNYLFNSAKWWDFSENWFIDQYNMLDIPTISFPESHDTLRIAAEASNQACLKGRIAFTGLISAAWMIISGTEWAWLRKTDVVKTSSHDQEMCHVNLETDVLSINNLREQYPLLAKQGQLQIRDHENHTNVVAIVRQFSDSDEGFLYLINKKDEATMFKTFDLNDFLQAQELKCIYSSCQQLEYSTNEVPLLECELKLFSFKVRS